MKNKNNIYQILKQYYSDIKLYFSENTQEIKNYHSLKLIVKAKLVRRDKIGDNNAALSEEINAGLENICNSVIEKMSKVFLTELSKTKHCLMEFGKDIQRIFSFPLSHLTDTNLKIKIEKLLSEELSILLLEDQFISVFLSKIKNFVEKFSSEELKSSFYKLEEDLYSNKNEMTNLTDCFIESIKSFITNARTNTRPDTNLSLNKLTNIVSEKRESIQSTAKPKEEPEFSKESTSIPTSTSVSHLKSDEIKIRKDLGIDELLEYIYANDDKEEKQKKRASSKKKTIKNLKKKDKSNRGNANRKDHECESEVNPKCDEVVELFKKSLAESIAGGPLRRKIKPKVSEDWIKNIIAIVNREIKLY